MKKKSLICFGIMLIIMILTVGCKKNDLLDYKNSKEKTSDIKSGKVAYEFEVVIENKLEGLSQKQINDLDYFKNIVSKANTVFDDNENKFISRNYYNFGGMGFDVDIYGKDEEFFIKIPVIGKYIKLDSEKTNKQQNTDQETENNIMSDKTLKKINKNWRELLTDEDVFGGKDSVLSTSDGEVKATKYTISLTDKQIKKFISESIDTFAQDQKLRQQMKKHIKFSDDKKSVKNLDKIFKEFKNLIKKGKVEEFNYVGYSDLDNYLIKESINISMSFNAVGPGDLKCIDYSIDIDRWDIGEKQEFDYPIIEDKDIISQDNANEQMPSVFKDMFKIEIDEEE